MKRFAMLLALALLVTGCHHRLHAEVTGSGKLQKQTRDVGSFNSIATEGAYHIQIVCNKPQSLEIEGDDNILPIISTEVSNNVLRIKGVRSYSTSKPITVRISVPNLEVISASGAGSFDVSGMKNDKFVIDASGAPTINVAGQTDFLNIDAKGAGKIDTHGLRAARVVVNSKGVARVEVYASKQLDVTVSGPSRVVYEGDAVVNKTVNGPGSVERKESEIL